MEREREHTRCVGAWASLVAFSGLSTPFVKASIGLTPRPWRAR